MLAMPQMRPAKSELSKNSPGSLDITYEGAPSPRELLENCVIQATAALKGLEATKHRSDDDAIGADEEEEMLLSKEEVERREKDRLAMLKLDENHLLAEFWHVLFISLHYFGEIPILAGHFGG